MEPTKKVMPVGRTYFINVPLRNFEWYAVRGYEPLSTGFFSANASRFDYIIDIGSHVGFYTLLAMQSNPKAKVISIEASIDNFLILKKNVEDFNPLNKPELFYGVFGLVPENRSFQITEASDNCSLFGHPNSMTVDRRMVPGITLEMLKIKKGQSVLAKVDVEGQEMEVLEALLHLKKNGSRLRLLVEFNPKVLRQAGFDPKSIIELLFENDFKIFTIDDTTLTCHEIFSFDSEDIQCIGDSYRNLYCMSSEELSM